MAKKIEHWDPEFCPEELSALYDFLDNRAHGLPEDIDHYIISKEYFKELEVYTCPEDHYDINDYVDVEYVAHFASMLERLKDIPDDAVLEIDLSNAY